MHIRDREIKPALDRWWNHVVKTETCWIWIGAKSLAGYGRFQSDGHLSLAHRVGYRALVGPIPSGLQLDHLCRTPSCVNPAHLEPVTAKENIRRHHSIQTHCSQGHEFTPANTRSHKRHWRICRQCSRIRELAYRERQKLKKEAQL